MCFPHLYPNTSISTGCRGIIGVLLLWLWQIVVPVPSSDREIEAFTAIFAAFSLSNVDVFSALLMVVKIHFGFVVLLGMVHAQV